MNNPLLAGYALVIVDLAVWRLKFPGNEAVRLFIRLIIFAILSTLLFGTGLSPFSQAPFVQSPALHVAGQILEVVWWLTGARLLALALDSLLLPKTWRKQRLFQDVFGAVVFLAAIVAALGFVFELPIRGLVATSGALAIVLGLAIQSTLSDVFAGIVINTTEPYQIGDWVSIDGVEGKVLEMNWRATHLLTAQGNVVIVPNALAAKTKITNNNRPPALHGVTVLLDISPEERPGIVIGALENALTASRSILSAPTPYAQVKRTSINSVQYEATAFVDNMAKKTLVSNELYDLCYRHLAAAGIDLHPLGGAIPAPGTRDSKERLLQRVDLFAALDNEAIQKLAARLSRHEYETGRVIVTADTVPDALTIIESGVLSVAIEEASGPAEIARLGPGETFGEGGLLAGLAASVQISTLSGTTAYQLNKDDLTPLLKDHPEVARRMCLLLSRRHDALGKLSSAPPQEPAADQSVLHWLLEKMHKLHSLTF